MDTFAKRLCDTLEKKNMRPSDLAELTGIGKSAISQYMKGAFRPKQVRTEKIASALGVSVAFLMGWSDDPQPITENRHIEPVYPFPIIGDVAAGYDCPAIEEYTGELSTSPPLGCVAVPETTFLCSVSKAIPCTQIIRMATGFWCSGKISWRAGPLQWLSMILKMLR